MSGRTYFAEQLWRQSVSFYQERKALGRCYIFGKDGRDHPTTHIGPLVNIDCEAVKHAYRITRRCENCGKTWMYESQEKADCADARKSEGSNDGRTAMDA